MTDKKAINYQAWAGSLIGFIRAKGLEHECTDWCGGWKCPIPTDAQPAPMKLTGDQIMGVLRRVVAPQLREQLTCKRWKDGIDIEAPTFVAERLAEEFVALSQPSLAATVEELRASCRPLLGDVGSANDRAFERLIAKLFPPAATVEDDELIGLNARLSDALSEIRELKTEILRHRSSSAANESELAAKLKEVHQQKLALWQAIAGGSEPRCRDCADFDGRCQGDGLPCDPQERALERIARLRAVPQEAPTREEVASAAERIIIQRHFDKKIDGYTLPMSLEIADAILALTRPRGGGK